MNKLNPKKILLMMPPFWDPLVPPQGICALKAYLEPRGYRVKTLDINIEYKFKQLYDRYFQVLSTAVPKEKHGNFYNIGHDVQRNHMMAHLHYDNPKQYRELVKILVYQTFFTRLKEREVDELNRTLDQYYRELEAYARQALRREQPGVLGLSVPRDSIASALFIFKLAREELPGMMTVMGGSIFSDHLLPNTPNFEYFLERTPYIDKIIIGEGEQLLYKLLEGEFPASKRVLTLKDIGGETLGFSGRNLPDMSDFDVGVSFPYLAAQASKSCPYRCSFCNVAPFFGRYKEKSAKQTAREMTEQYRRYGQQLFFMNDALLNYTASGLADEILKGGTALYWDGYLRVDKNVCDPDNPILWRRGGFYRARLGVESGSTNVLQRMDKRITIRQTIDSVTNLAEAGIKTTTYWVIGHPGETESDFQETLRLLEELKNNIYEAECNPFIFGYSGQSASDSWADSRRLLYPAEAREMLIMQSWTVDGDPGREETYHRVYRFVNHCKQLGIPNPYSLHDIDRADRRWQNLHKNAVPPLIDFKDKTLYIDESKHIKKIQSINNTIQETGDFDF